MIDKRNKIKEEYYAGRKSPMRALVETHQVKLKLVQNECKLDLDVLKEMLTIDYINDAVIESLVEQLIQIKQHHYYLNYLLNSTFSQVNQIKEKKYYRWEDEPEYEEEAQMKNQLISDIQQNISQITAEKNIIKQKIGECKVASNVKMEKTPRAFRKRWFALYPKFIFSRKLFQELEYFLTSEIDQIEKTLNILHYAKDFEEVSAGKLQEQGRQLPHHLKMNYNGELFKIPYRIVKDHIRPVKIIEIYKRN